ncbi:MAG: 5'-3' exonuclease H3TH domain-containing protein [Patescibacteria group bacterium]|nr:5'-3' exonuclease H3TH domain-containing protein [Patescibacteria group bacterium]
MAKLILIDAQAVLHRAWHALPKLTDSHGQVINAVYGFSSLLLKLINEQNPDYLVVAFDTKAPTFRHQEYKEYKAGREKQPAEFYDQIPLSKKIVEAFGLPIFIKEGFEADDLIGAVIQSQKKKNPKIESLIVSGDLDLCQLVGPRTSVYYLRQGLSQIKIYDLKAVRERFELEPEQLIDFKALRGDPSDNIKGMTGIGPKIALKLIKNFKTLDNLYEYLENCFNKGRKCEIKQSLAEKLWQNKEQVLRDKRLVTIQKNIPGLEAEKIKKINFDYKKINKIFEEFGFKSLIKRLMKNHSNQSVIKTNLITCKQNKLF